MEIRPMGKPVALILMAILPTVVAGQSRGVHMEHALEANRVFGNDSDDHSALQLFSEVGYMLEGRPRENGTGWGGGGTLFLGADGQEVFWGLKPRVRYRINPQWTLDLSAGLTLNAPSRYGRRFMLGVHLNTGKWWTFRAAFNVRKAKTDAQAFDSPDPGYKTAFDLGVALRNREGAIAMAATWVIGALLVAAWAGGA